jgi:extracellular elastinolytic metalloproteinase
LSLLAHHLSHQVRYFFDITSAILTNLSTESIASSNPTITLAAAISTAEKALNGTFNQHPATIEYLAKDDGSVALTHVIQIRNETAGTWYQAFVDAHSGDLLSITDFVSQASVSVVP